MSDDISWVLAANGGDARAWEHLIRGHRERLYRFVVTMTGDSAVAEDVTQESLRRALERLSTLEHPGRFGSWLLAIAANACRSHFREQQSNHPRNALPLDEESRSSQRRSALSSLVRRESADLLATAIDGLPHLLREAFVLAHVEGVPYEDVARELATEPKTLYVRAHRAKALLRRRLGSAVDTLWTRPEKGI